MYILQIFKQIAKPLTSSTENMELFDYAVSHSYKKQGLTRIKNFLLLLLQFFVLIFFAPLILILRLFEKKDFVRVLKQIVVILYVICSLILIYTLFSMDKTLKYIKITSIPINYQEKIRLFK